VERRASKSSHDEDGAENHGRRRQPDQAQHDNREDRPADDEHAWTPAIRERTEAELRHRTGHLEAHCQRARRDERQPEVRDEQRQERRVEIVVRVHDEVRRGHLEDPDVEPEPAAADFGHSPTRRRIIATASPNSGILSTAAAPASTASAAAIASASRAIWITRLPPGMADASHW